MLHDDVPVATQDDITRLVSTYLPQFKKLCDQGDADLVLLNQRSFGNSESALLLLAMAIKYAGIAGKTVTIHL